MPSPDTCIRNAEAATGHAKLTDGGGLYLEVTATGGKRTRAIRLVRQPGAFRDRIVPDRTKPAAHDPVGL